MKNHMRDALVTAALFGSVSAAVAPISASSRDTPPQPPSKVSGHGSVDESFATKAAAAAVFPNGKRDLARAVG